MSVGQVLGYVTSLMNDWGISSIIQAALLILVTVGTFVAVRRLLQGS